MIKKFLKAKHWQIFLIMYGIPILFQIILLGLTFTSDNPIYIFSTFPIFMIVSVGTLFGWFWSIGVGLHNRLPQNSNLNLKKFKIFFFIPLIYILFITFSLMTVGIFSDSPPPNGMVGIGIGILIPLHLLSMFCLFYLLYFCSKTIKSIELNRDALFGDYAAEFFLLWFFIIGIWIIQPKINIIANESTTSNIVNI